MPMTEEYDSFEPDDPFYRADRLPSAIREWVAADGVRAQRITLGRSDKEKTRLAYILYSLAHGQEYDVGRAILWASQVGCLSDRALEMIAALFLSNEVVFRGQVGRSLLVKFGRSVGVRWYESGNKDLGTALLQMAIDLTHGLGGRKRYPLEAALQKWTQVREQVPNLPRNIDNALERLIRSYL